jgi:hypothetical protein
VTTEIEAVEQYVAFWNSTAEPNFADDITYRAPVGVLRGVDALVDFRTQFAAHQPGYEFRVRSQPQAHHGRARLPWELVVDGKSFATGTDVLEVDEDGRIRSVAGFLDNPPEGFAPHDH